MREEKINNIIRNVFIVTGILESLVFVFLLVISLIFGIAGFTGGEMGLIIGILMTIGFGLFVSGFVLRLMALIGIFKRNSNRRIYYIYNIILYSLYLIVIIFNKDWILLIYPVSLGALSVYSLINADTVS